MSKKGLGNLGTYRLTEQKMGGRSFQGWSSHVTVSSIPRHFSCYLFRPQCLGFFVLPHACCLMIVRWLPLFQDCVLTQLFEGSAQRSIPGRDFLFISLILSREEKYFSIRLQWSFLYVSLATLDHLPTSSYMGVLGKQVCGFPTFCHWMWARTESGFGVDS